jgi:multidrug efflux pump
MGLVVFVLIIVGVAFLFNRLPSSFLPDEDQGILITSVTLPPGATDQRTKEVLAQVRDYYLNKEKDYVEGVFTVAGFGFGGQGQNVGLAFIALKDFGLRTTPQAKAQAIAGVPWAASPRSRTAASLRWRRPPFPASALRAVSTSISRTSTDRATTS